MKDQGSEGRRIGRRALIGLLALDMAAGRRLGLAQTPGTLPRVGRLHASSRTNPLGMEWIA